MKNYVSDYDDNYGKSKRKKIKFKDHYDECLSRDEELKRKKQKNARRNQKKESSIMKDFRYFTQVDLENTESGRAQKTVIVPKNF